MHNVPLATIYLSLIVFITTRTRLHRVEDFALNPPRPEFSLEAIVKRIESSSVARTL